MMIYLFLFLSPATYIYTLLHQTEKYFRDESISGFMFVDATILELEGASERKLLVILLSSTILFLDL